MSNEHQFKVNDRVKVRFPGGSVREGIINATELVYSEDALGYINKFEVHLKDDNTYFWFAADELIWADDPAHKLKWNQCTCGADGAYAPNKPPGHTYYCNKQENPTDHFSFD